MWTCAQIGRCAKQFKVLPHTAVCETICLEDKIEAMNKLPNAVDDSSGFEKRVYTVEEIMDILSIGKNTAYALVNSGVFHFVKVGGHYRISKKSFDRWLDNMDSESSGCQLCD